ncbi:MAG: hypothetical protein AAF704_09675 [Cyanobacteria bacterium P01_D01_bin.123]
MLWSIASLTGIATGWLLQASQLSSAQTERRSIGRGVRCKVQSVVQSFGFEIVLKIRGWQRAKTLISRLRLRRWAIAFLLGATCWLTVSLPLTATAKDLPPKFVELQAQVDDMQALIDRRDWLELINYIHGPMGMTRLNLLQIAYDAPAELQGSIRDRAKAISGLLNRMDVAATEYDTPSVEKAQRDFAAAVNAIALELE